MFFVLALPLLLVAGGACDFASRGPGFEDDGAGGRPVDVWRLVVGPLAGSGCFGITDDAVAHVVGTVDDDNVIVVVVADFAVAVAVAAEAGNSAEAAAAADAVSALERSRCC